MTLFLAIAERSLEFFRFLLVNPVLSVVSRRTDCFNYRRLLKLRFAPFPFMLPENSHYGYSRAIRNFGGRAYGSRIEHGVFFAESVVADMDLIFTPFRMMLYRLRRVYTFSPRRRDLIMKYLAKRGIRLEVVAVGPYILHAKHFLSAVALKNIKARLGRVLTVYPLHSIESVAYDYDCQSFLDEIARLKPGYDTVLVSLYWMDIKRGFASVYENAGCTVVCAGRRDDPNFLSRQKDILALSDRVVTNAVGTHLGFAVAMNCPCTLFKQTISREASAGPDEAAAQEEWRKNTFPFYSAFAAEDGEITEVQRNLVSEFWG